MALLLDMEEAIDRVDFNYMKGCLKKIGIPDQWITFLSAIYGGAESCVMVNRHISRPVPILRGVRQGCPMSPRLFLICIEPLACLLRNESDLKGISLNGIRLIVRGRGVDAGVSRSAEELLEAFNEAASASGNKKPILPNCQI